MNVAGQTVEELLSNVASESVAPAGGTAASLVGAVGASLCEMVCLHTVGGREQSVEEETPDGVGEGASSEADELAEVGAKLHDLREQLLELGDADADAVDDVFASGGRTDDAGTKRAVGVPLATAEACRDVLELAPVVTKRGAPSAMADAGTGVILTYAALRASLHTVRANTGSIDDRAFVESVDRRARAAETAAETAVESVFGGDYPGP